MTGAPIPKGADAVVAFEDIFSTSINSITLDKPVTQGHGIGIKDINATQGQTILTKGTQITPVELGRISMLGITHVQVYTRPRVAVLSTGNELLLPGMSLTHGKLYNSSQFTICAFLEQSGAVPLSCGIAPDNANTIANTMRLALNNNSMLITTGGLGGGDFDLITEAMRIAGANILLSGGTFRPGGNFAAATLDGKLILALSGSPASALLAFHLLGLPHTRRLSQNICWRLKEVEVLLGALPERPTNGLLPGILKIMHGLAIFHPLSLRDLESNAVELILPLSGNEPLELWRREKTPIKAFTVGPRI